MVHSTTRNSPYMIRFSNCDGLSRLPSKHMASKQRNINLDATLVASMFIPHYSDRLLKETKSATMNIFRKILFSF